MINKDLLRGLRLEMRSLGVWVPKKEEAADKGQQPTPTETAAAAAGEGPSSPSMSGGDGDGDAGVDQKEES